VAFEIVVLLLWRPTLHHVALLLGMAGTRPELGHRAGEV
jgi:hypothetical protein